MNEEEKTQIYDYILDKISYKTNIQFMCSIQLIIYYLTKEKKPIDSKIIDIIYKVSYLNICSECELFFSTFPKINIDNLYEIFSFIELLCYDLICNNLYDKFKLDLDKKTEEKINAYFKNGVHKLIEKINLASACRKLISRYLLSTTSVYINSDNLLSTYLSDTDLWNKEIIKNDLFQMELNNINDFNVKIGQVYKLCSLLDPDNILLKDIILKFEDKKKKETIIINGFKIKKIKKEKRPRY